MRTRNNFKDMTGLRFGRLAVLCRSEHNRSDGSAMWVCDCDCGNQIVTLGSRLRRGGARSCGCLSRDLSVEKARKMGRATRKHGASFTPLYSVWAGLKSRCRNPKNPQFKHYGRRGIKVCDRWRNGEEGKSGFECFLEDMGEKPSSVHSIDRINTDGDYEPANCRWATKKEQNNNTRANHMVEYGGDRMSVSMAIERSGIRTCHSTVYTRLARGWSLDRALT